MRAGLVGLSLLGAAGLFAMYRPAPDETALLVKAQADFKAGRLDDAEAGLARLAAMRPQKSMEHMALAQIAIARDQPEKALAELRGIPDRDPLAAIARTLTGQVELKQGKARLAEAQFLAAIRIEPKAVEARRELVYIYNIQHRQKEVDAHVHVLSEVGSLPYDQLLHWSQTRNIVWNPTRDCEALERFIANDPDDRDSRLALADGLRQLGRMSEAAKAIAPLPDTDVQAKIRRILWAFDDGDHARAEALLADGVGDEPGLARLRGQLALARGDARGAIHYLKTAVDFDPLDRPALFALATAYKLQGEEPKGARYLDQAKKHDALTPLITRASTNEGRLDLKLPSQIGAACAEAGRLYEALAWYKNAIARDPLDTKSQGAIFSLTRQIAEKAPATASASTTAKDSTSRGRGADGQGG
ncbi:tetratricopeptide repeat protein [Singulisphaera sp. PoT]|uniref:tetratricopeptide repeat protein n=1 Tax=Singulisphaera sp. PoT TaxID=3411797 RepID=UPI003BF50990